jgi:PAS domain S-box-containing protein
MAPDDTHEQRSRVVDTAQSLQRVLGTVVELLDADKGTIHLHGDDEHANALVASVGFAQSSADPLAAARFDVREPIIVEDVMTDPRISVAACETCAAQGIRALLSVPLVRSDGMPMGRLTTYRARPERPAAGELRRLQLFALQVAQLIEAKRAEHALRQHEAGLRFALDVGEIGSWEWNIRTGEISWSENLEQIHGLVPGSFGGTFEAYKALIHLDDRERVLAAIYRTLDGGGDFEAEFRCLESSGAVRWMQGKGKVLADAQGRAARMIGVCMDITKRKRAEQSIVEADRRKDEFLAMISHELRNPLAAITCASELLEQGDAAADDVVKARGVIKRQTEQLTRIVEDLLDVSRLTAGKLTLEKVALDLSDVVERCVAELAARGLLEQHAHQLVCASAPVHGDVARLEQVVTNLLTNAIKYTPAGGTITIAVGREAGEAVLRVKDTGIGIGPELLPRIFDLFVQSARGIDRRDGGLGVGLSIVRRLIEAHGGRVEAHSAGASRGAELVVRLPLAAAQAARGASHPGAWSTARPRRLLIIDDNVDAREGLAGLLRLAGHEVHEADDGPHGLASALDLRPEVVLVDIGLPGFDGFELARKLKATGASPSLIAVTGYGTPDQRRLGAEAGFDAYLIKPIAVKALLELLPRL